MMRTIFILSSLVVLIAGCSPAVRGGRDARALYERGDYAGAERAAEQALVSEPMDPELQRLAMAAAIRRGAHQRGVELYMQWHRARRHYDRVALRAMAVSSLWQALHEPDAEGRGQAIAAVEEVAMDDLGHELALLLRDESTVIAASAAVALAGSDRQARARAMELWHNPDPEVRGIVVEGLGRDHDAGVRDVLVAALDDPDSRVRRAAVQALGRRPLPGDLTRFAQMARTDQSGPVRAAAWHAFFRGKPENGPAYLQAALADSYLGARLAALVLLAKEPAGSRELLRELAVSSDLYVALRATVMLYKAGEPAPIRTLQWALNQSRWTVRVAALHALAEAVRPGVALGLLDAPLADERLEVRLAAARILLRFGEHSRAASIFAATLDAPRDELRIQAAVDLIRMDDERGRDALTRLSHSPSVATRRAAARAHRYLDNATLPLVTALGDPSAVVRVEAASSLLALLR